MNQRAAFRRRGWPDSFGDRQQCRNVLDRWFL